MKRTLLTVTATVLLSTGPAQAAGSRASSLLLTLFALLWLGLWAGALASPALRLPGMSPLAVSITVKLFWLPWLLLPAALLPAATDEAPHGND